MLARLIGKSDIYTCRVEIFGDIKTFDFLQISHEECGDVLSQVVNITRDGDKLIGDCKIIGYRDSGVLRNIRTPFANDAKIELADDSFIEKTVGLNSQNDAFLGVLEHHPDLKITLDLKKTITKHIAVLAKSGAGKSYTVGVLLEEIIKKNIPIIILDPHNEYSTLKYPNTDKKDGKRLELFGLQPQGFQDQIKEYSPDTQTNPQCEEITLDINKMKPQDLVEALPQKLSPSQQSLMFNILSNLNNKVDFDELIFNISNEESNAKWSLITLLEQLKKLRIYSSNPTPLKDIVKYKQASIISLKGVEPYVQETFVAGLLKELFEARKKEEIPPFFLVLEEAHNFTPEASMGKVKTSKIVKTLAGEGRKFGIGLCVISQRPAKVDKNVISQCGTQILLKVTNPNDLKSVVASSEGVDSASENEIQRLNIGTSLLTGVIDIPLKTNIRPRVSKHGGETVDITLPYEVDEKTSNETSSQEKEEVSQPTPQSSSAHKEMVQFIGPEVDKESAEQMAGKKLQKILAPASLFKLSTSSGKIQILVDREQQTIVSQVFPLKSQVLPKGVESLSSTELNVLKEVMNLQDRFNPAELLMKTDIMFNEILRVCDSLAQKGLLKKIGREFEHASSQVFRNIHQLGYKGQQLFEEVEFDGRGKETISQDEISKLLSLIGSVENVKEVFLLRYD